MSVVSTITDILLGGGATGLLSGGLSMWGKLQEQKQNHEFRKHEMNFELGVIRENSRHESLMADHELIISRQKGSHAERVTAIDAEGKLADLSNVSGWVNNIRALNRPLLSYVLIGGAFWMHWVAHNQAKAFVVPSEAQMLLTIFITNAAASAVGFWFGDRVITNQK